MEFLKRLFSKKELSQSLSEEASLGANTELVEKLLAALVNEFSIDSQINACEELAELKSFGEKDVISALVSAAKKAVMQWEIKRMTVASMHRVKPEQISVQPHADDSRVTLAVVKTLRKLADRKDNTGSKAKSALEDVKKSIKNAELTKKIAAIR